MKRRAAAAVLPLVMFAVLLLLPAGQHEPGEAATYKVDPVHACVWFRIKHLDVAYFYGRFNDIAGEFVLDEKDPGNSRIEVRVQAASIDTANADRDKHLKSAELFDVEKFPQITFTSRSFKPAGADTYEVAGDLTFHGVKRPLTVKLEKTGAGKDPWGNYRVGLETTFTVKRSEFGMTAMPGALGEDVRLTVSVEGLRQ